MRPRRRTSILALAASATTCMALAFAGGAVAAPNTQQIGPYTVTDDVTNDGTNTTATYTVTVPNDTSLSLLAAAAPTVQAISHVDVGVCQLDGRTYTIDPSGSFSATGDPSVNNLTSPVIKWNGSQNPGTTVTYSYTVPGVWQASPQTFYIKSGSYGGTRDPNDPFTGTVQGVACQNTPEQPENPGTPGNNPTTSSQPQVGGQQQVLGERVTRGTARIAGATGCQRKAFKVRVRGTQIRKVVFTIDGRRVTKVSRSGGVYTITIDPMKYRPGSHLVQAKATFRASSNTRAKTMRLRFARCIRTAPAFTG